MNVKKVDILVCGRFHFHKYLKYLEKYPIEGSVTYSYRINYDFGLKRFSKHNFYLKEYLYYLGMKFLKGKLVDRYLRVLHLIWQYQILLFTKCDADVVEFLVHGNCYKAIQKYKKNKSKTIGVVVNAHPTHQREILSNEYRKYGLEYNAGELFFAQYIELEYKLCDIILVPSTWVKQSLLKYGDGIDESKIIIQRYGLDSVLSPPARPIKSSTSKLKLLYVGLITFRKGVIYLLEATKKLQEHGINIELHLVGKIDTLYFPIIQEYLGLSYVIHEPHVPNQSMLDFMSGFDILVMPSLEDGFGVVVSEALSVGLPAIVTNTCGASDLIENMKNGIVIESASCEQIFNAVLALKDTEFAQEKKISTWEEYASGVYDLYEKLLS